ncbi:MAG: response regulator [Thermodesulfobacteriota bacterium]
MDTKNTKVVGRHVLVMDDEATIRHLLQDSLGYLGYEVTATSNGEEAIAAYKSRRDNGGKFDAVIMDLTVRDGMGGSEAAMAIIQQYPDAVMIAASGDATDPVILQPEPYGFVECIVKPFNLGELAAKIRSLIGA